MHSLPLGHGGSVSLIGNKVYKAHATNIADVHQSCHLKDQILKQHCLSPHGSHHTHSVRLISDMDLERLRTFYVLDVVISVLAEEDVYKNNLIIIFILIIIWVQYVSKLLYLNIST